MLNLTNPGTADLLDMITSAAGTIKVHVSWVDDVVESVGPPRVNIFNEDRTQTAITTATTTTICPGPASTTKRNVKYINVRNDDAALSNVVTVRFNANGTIGELFSCTLLIDEVLVMRDGTWFHYDSNGGVYGQSLPVASDTVVGGIEIASQAEMEAGTDMTRAVVPGRQHFHPSACKAWGKAPGAGTSLTVGYNVAGVVDTGTGRLGVTIGTDFSTANYSIGAQLERTVTALTATGVEDSAIRNASPTAGVFEIESYDQTAITFAAQDPANYFWECFGDHA